MAAYKDRIREDLDRWIGAGLVGADKRDAILATIPEARRLDAAAALAWVGAVLLGAAVVSFVAANWDITPKLVRFAILLATFVSVAGAAAWAAHKERALASNILLMVAALVFAAAVGLTGQIFDIAADPRAACYASGLVAFALALAGRSSGAAIVGLVFIALGDVSEREWFSGLDTDAPWMLFAAPLGAYLALRWSSAPLAHVSALAILYCFGWFAAHTHSRGGALLFLSVGVGAMAAGARWLHARERPLAGVFYGWFAWGALVLFAAAGYAPWIEGSRPNIGAILHRLAWLLLSGGLIALGRYDRHALVTTVGVLGVIGAMIALLNDMGLDLLAAAGVFFACAIVALLAGLALRRKAR
jgi:uncharacterized membrane protein